jgi:hypothetical protein
LTARKKSSCTPRCRVRLPRHRGKTETENACVYVSAARYIRVCVVARTRVLFGVPRTRTHAAFVCACVRLFFVGWGTAVLNVGQPSFERDVHAATEQFECLRRLLTSKVRMVAVPVYKCVRTRHRPLCVRLCVLAERRLYVYVYATVRVYNDRTRLLIQWGVCAPSFCETRLGTRLLRRWRACAASWASALSRRSK